MLFFNDAMCVLFTCKFRDFYFCNIICYFLDEDQSVTLGYYFIYIDTHARAPWEHGLRLLLLEIKPI